MQAIENNHIVKILKGRIFLAILMFIIGFYFAFILSGWDTVGVEMDNRSNKKIKEIRLVHENGELVKKNLDKDKSDRLEYLSHGESEYHLEIVFEDDKSLIGGYVYVEGGYKTREVIYENKIETDYLGFW